MTQEPHRFQQLTMMPFFSATIALLAQPASASIETSDRLQMAQHAQEWSDRVLGFAAPNGLQARV